MQDSQSVITTLLAGAQVVHDPLVTLINTPFRVEKLITTARVEFAKYGCLITAAPVELN